MAENTDTAADQDLSAEDHRFASAAAATHTCPNGHEHQGWDNNCGECEHGWCCANAED